MTIAITVSGRGGAFGVGSISEEQYEYWIDHEEDLAAAFQQSLDQKDLPEDIKIEDYYDAFNDVGATYGLYEDSLHIKITNNQNQINFDGSYSEYYDFYDLGNFEDETIEEHIEQSTELYVPFLEQDIGYFVYWSDYQKGILINCQISAENLDPNKLKFSFCDLNGESSLITSMSYNQIPLDIDLSGMLPYSFECSLHRNI